MEMSLLPRRFWMGSPWRTCVNDTGLLDFYDEDYTITIGVFARK